MFFVTCELVMKMRCPSVVLRTFQRMCYIYVVQSIGPDGKTIGPCARLATHRIASLVGLVHRARSPRIISTIVSPSRRRHRQELEYFTCTLVRVLSFAHAFAHGDI